MNDAHYCRKQYSPNDVKDYDWENQSYSESAIECWQQVGVKKEEVTDNAKFVDDLGADSLDTVELVMALEEEFGVEIPDEDAEKLATVGDALRYIEEKAGK